MEVGGETKEMEMDGATTRSVILLVADGLLTASAVIVTVFPMGIIEGAV